MALFQTSVQVCAVPDEIKAVLRKFRFRKEKTNAAIIRNRTIMRIEGDGCSEGGAGADGDCRGRGARRLHARAGTLRSIDYF